MANVCGQFHPYNCNIIVTGYQMDATYLLSPGLAARLSMRWSIRPLVTTPNTKKVLKKAQFNQNP